MHGPRGVEVKLIWHPFAIMHSGLVISSLRNVLKRETAWLKNIQELCESQTISTTDLRDRLRSYSAFLSSKLAPTIAQNHDEHIAVIESQLWILLVKDEFVLGRTSASGAIDIFTAGSYPTLSDLEIRGSTEVNLYK